MVRSQQLFVTRFDWTKAAATGVCPGEARDDEEPGNAGCAAGRRLRRGLRTRLAGDRPARRKPRRGLASGALCRPLQQRALYRGGAIHRLRNECQKYRGPWFRDRRGFHTRGRLGGGRRQYRLFAVFGHGRERQPVASLHLRLGFVGHQLHRLDRAGREPAPAAGGQLPRRRVHRLRRLRPLHRHQRPGAVPGRILRPRGDPPPARRSRLRRRPPPRWRRRRRRAVRF